MRKILSAVAFEMGADVYLVCRANNVVHVVGLLVWKKPEVLKFGNHRSNFSVPSGDGFVFIEHVWVVIANLFEEIPNPVRDLLTACLGLHLKWVYAGTLAYRLRSSRLGIWQG